jgi:hypothetical protein
MTSSNPFLDRRAGLLVALLLTVLAFAVRVNNIGFNSLSEDEAAKWRAVEEYQHGHFAGVNSEHPMMLKALACLSIEVGKRWNQFASSHNLPTMRPEGWLRLPNVLFGAATTFVIYLLGRRMLRTAGALAACFFWAVAPIPVAINRLAKEETLLMFFTLLACYFHFRAKQAQTDTATRRSSYLSAIGFGLSFASQYVVHLFGLNALAWYLAGKAGLDRKPIVSTRFFLVIALTFVLVNPVILSPSNLSCIMGWVDHGGASHHGYDFNGALYLNFPSQLFAGVPWYYYFSLLIMKTPIPMLLAIIAGSILLLRRRDSLAFCCFISMGLLQMVGLSVSGGKWIRYSLWVLPFLYLAGGYAIQEAFRWMRGRRMSPVIAGAAAVLVCGGCFFDLCAWSPYYSFYLNSVGGGARNVARFFSPDEVAESDTRQVAELASRTAPAHARLATARPLSMAWYIERCGRSDIQVTPLYDRAYGPRSGDLIVLEPSRRFLETQRYFDLLEKSGIPCREVRFGPVLTSTVYVFNPSMRAQTPSQELFFASLRKSEGNRW